jgi:FdhD protein
MSLPEVQLEHRSSEPEEVQTHPSLSTAHPSVRSAEIFLVKRGEIALLQDAVAVEEALEIQLVYGAADDRKVKSISITMRTPGNDDELAAGFLMTEGVVRDAVHITSISTPSAAKTAPLSGAGKVALPTGLRSQVIRVELSPEVEVSMSTLERNFYTTSSCGVCGKASLLLLGLFARCHSTIIS